MNSALSSPSASPASTPPGPRAVNRHAPPDELARLIPVKALYRPSDAAAICGISEDRVTDNILSRPNLFPVRQWARRHEWSADEFVVVIFVLCSLSPRARKNIEKRVADLAKINAGKMRQNRG